MVVGTLYLGLGAALARDGALPAYLAKGAAPAQVPRRSLALLGGQSVLWLVASEVLHLGLTPLMLLATGCFTLVYVLGTAAAVRLLPRGTRVWWTAVVAFASVGALLGMNGWHVLWALGIVVAAVTYQWWRGRHPLVAGCDHDGHEEAEADRDAGRDAGAARDVLLRA